MVLYSLFLDNSSSTQLSKLYLPHVKRILVYIHTQLSAAELAEDEYDVEEKKETENKEVEKEEAEKETENKEAEKEEETIEAEKEEAEKKTEKEEAEKKEQEVLISRVFFWNSECHEVENFGTHFNRVLFTFSF